MLLVLYLGGQLKINSTNILSEVRNKILYDSIQRESIKSTYQNVFEREISLIPIMQDRNRALDHTNTLLKQIELLSRQDLTSFFSIEDNKNKFIEDMKNKYKLFEKLGVFNHE